MKREPLMTPAYFAQAITDIRADIEQRTAKLDAVVAAWERWLACAPPPANDLRYKHDDELVRFTPPAQPGISGSTSCVSNCSDSCQPR
jgi:hypothetical protein